MEVPSVGFPVSDVGPSGYTRGPVRSSMGLTVPFEISLQQSPISPARCYAVWRPEMAK